jgi:ATP-dependent RNA helicase DHX8/PRP22
MDFRWFPIHRKETRRMEGLQELALTNRVRHALETHTGIGDKTLAEFVIDLCRKSQSLSSFRELVFANGGDVFPEVAIEQIYTIVRPPQPSLQSLSSSSNSSIRTASDVHNAMEHSRKRDVEQMSSDGPRKQAMSEQERWEAMQLTAAGVKTAVRVTHDEEIELEDMEDAQVAVRPDVPAFLKGYAKPKGKEQNDLLRIVKNPDGTLQRAAYQQSSLSKERREQRGQDRRGGSGGGRRDRRYDNDPVASASDDPFTVDDSASHSQRSSSRRSDSSSNSTASSKSLREQRESLPIFKYRESLLQHVRDNKMLVVIGETGSGKTTQLTQYLVESGIVPHGKKVGCTQPRRVAAISVAKRVAEERGVRLGREVGYSIRFEDCTSPDTNIKYMTDGMLLRECLLDNMLSGYACIVLDEAHERTVHTDVLFGLLKAVVQRRAEFRLIVTSATLEATKFAEYFCNCPVFRIPGRTFPVEKLYVREPESDYMEAALTTVMQIHASEPPGDILLFLTGQEEIEIACEVLNERMSKQGGQSRLPKLLVLPVYSALPSELQSQIFDPAPPGARKCVVATNIAETSITIDGIYYVVDPGFCKQKVYNPKLGMDSLLVVPISQASADQRAGRAGRTGPGKCYRLYTEDAFHNEMHPTTLPEIQRTNLGNTVLMLKALGINDLLRFDFLDPPQPAALYAAMEQLYALGALDEDGLLTQIGRRMAEFPMDPPMSKMLLASVELGCSDEVMSIIGMLSVQSIFYRPKEKQDVADQKRSKFFQAEGDHLTLLAVYQAWERSHHSSSWCFENFVHLRGLKRAQDVRNQLVDIMKRQRLPIESCGNQWVRVQKAICAGYFGHAAKRDPQEGYKTAAEATLVYIHPSSALFGKPPQWVVYHELVLTSKEYMREILQIDPRWLVEVAPHYFKDSGNRIPHGKHREKIKPLFDRRLLHDEDWRISRQRKYNK